MAFSTRYKGVIWTNHVLERLADRNISQEIAWKTLWYPDTTKKGQKSHSKEFIKQIEDRKITVIATQNEEKEWIVMSCWAYPPFPGSIDISKRKRYLQYKHSSLAGKIWIRIKQSIGLHGDF